MGTYKAVIRKDDPENMHSIWLITDYWTRMLTTSQSFGFGEHYCGICLQPGEDLLSALDRLNYGRRGAPSFKDNYYLEDPWIQPGGYLSEDGDSVYPVLFRDAAKCQ